MSILIFNGEMERKASSTSFRIANCLKGMIEQRGQTATIFHLGTQDIPVFDVSVAQVPAQVTSMAKIFRDAHLHIWLTPLYHGSMTGAMKNALDWLEVTAGLNPAYLTNKVVALVCWAGGSHAMQGINAMDSVVKALRAWTLPYTVPAIGRDLFDGDGITAEYERRFDMMLNLLLTSPEFQLNTKTATLI